MHVDGCARAARSRRPVAVRGAGAADHAAAPAAPLPGTPAKPVGVVGLGKMGTAMVGNFLADGIPMVVFDGALQTRDRLRATRRPRC